MTRRCAYPCRRIRLPGNGWPGEPRGGILFFGPMKEMSGEVTFQQRSEDAAVASAGTVEGHARARLRATGPELEVLPGDGEAEMPAATGEATVSRVGVAVWQLIGRGNKNALPDTRLAGTATLPENLGETGGASPQNAASGRIAAEPGGVHGRAPAVGKENRRAVPRGTAVQEAARVERSGLGGTLAPTQTKGEAILGEIIPPYAPLRRMRLILARRCIGSPSRGDG